MTLYRVHGLVIESELVLPALPAPAGSAVTLRAFYQPFEAPAPDRRQEELASSDSPTARYQARRGDFGLHCSYGSLGQVLFTPDARVLVDAGDDESAAALLTGSALAIWLISNAELVLHASAVAWGELSVAIVGGSHSGKTTFAAQCVLAGARLLGDDVLRVATTPPAAVWHAGVQWLRLRSGAAALLSAWAGSSYQSARDERWVATPPEVDAPALGSLAALVFPSLSEDGSVSVKPVGPAEVLQRLLLVPRVRGLHSHALLREQLRRTGDLARTVPGFDVSVPVGPPFLRQSAYAVLRELTGWLGGEKTL
jgi:hypothetical protein